jgi:anti-sigma regulatory factor (Ser/Thr protein kinase)
MTARGNTGFAVADGTRRMSFLELAPLPGAVPCARLHAVNVLAEWGLDDLADDAALVISELMTNAVRASAALPARPPVLLHLTAGQRSLRVEVHDSSPAEPVFCTPDPGAEHGRGLAVVVALSARCGSQRAGHCRKVVWAELARP